MNYTAVDKLLEYTADEYDCEKLCVCCYDNLLENLLGYKRTNCYYKMTVNEIVKSHPCEKLILRVNAHLTCGINGKTLDIWDCTDELVDCYWIVS